MKPYVQTLEPQKKKKTSKQLSYSEWDITVI
jgi:hypothetical protein